MARLATSGFELGGFDGSGGVDGAASGGTLPTYDTSVKRSGARSLKCSIGGTTALCYADWRLASAVATGTTVYLRAYINVGAYGSITSSDPSVMDILNSAGSTIASLFLWTTADADQGKLYLWNWVTNTYVGGSKVLGPKLNTGQWYRIEMAVKVPAAGNGTAEFQQDGVSIVSATENVGTTAIQEYTVGMAETANNINTTYNFDDVALNDSTGTAQNSWPGEGSVVLLTPASDNARTGFTTDSAGTTSLFNATKNTPPAGVADTTAGTGLHQVRDATSSTTDKYDANLTTYTAAGVPAGSTVKLVQAFMFNAAASATSPPSMALFLVSNASGTTESAETSYASAGTAGTWPTGWVIRKNASLVLTAQPTLGTAPVLRVGKRTASTRVAMSCFAGLLVEYVAPASFSRTATESAITASDVATGTVGEARTASEPAVSASDAATRGVQAFTRTASEPAKSVSDSATRASARARTATESAVSASDVATRAATPHARTATEPAVSVSDAAVVGAGPPSRTATEPAVSASDVATRNAIARVRTASEPAIAASDVAVKLLHTTRSAVEPAISVGDAVVRGRGVPRTATEVAVAVSDAAVRAAIGRARLAAESAITVSDLAVLSAVHITYPVGARLRVRELPPLKLTYLVTTPDGHVKRLADDCAPQDRPQSETHSSVMPGGYENISFELMRRLGQHSDLQELSRIDVEGVGGLKAWQGRLEKLPDTAGDTASITPTGVGYQSALSDNATARMIPVDRDFANWLDSSAAEKIYQLSGGVFGSIQGPNVQPDKDTGQSELDLTLNSPPWQAGLLPLAEAWYDAHGVPIAKLIFTTRPGPLVDPADTNYRMNGVLMDANTSAVLGDDSGNAVATGTYVVDATTSSRKWARLAFWYAAASTTPESSDYTEGVTMVVVCGSPLLPLYSTRDGLSWGVKGSDVTAQALSKWAPSLRQNIAPTDFVIPHLVFWDPTTVADIVKGAMKFDLHDWWVDEGPSRSGPTYNSAPRDDHGKKWRARAWPSKLQANGPDISRIWNGVCVSFTDVTGVTRTVGPPGTYCDFEDVSLQDLDPENPCNRGPSPSPRYAPLQMSGTSTSDGAIRTGQLFLQEQKSLDTSGQAALVGHVQDVSGVVWPAYMVKAGDQISFVDAADPSYRRIIHASWDDPNKTNTIQLDQPPDSMQALLERLSVVLVPLGLS